MISNRKKAIASVAKMKAWIATSPEIPTHKGRINRSRICSILEIPVSTIRSNRELGKLFESLSQNLPPVPKESTSERIMPAMQALLDKLADQEILIEELCADNAHAQFLLSTGIVLP